MSRGVFDLNPVDKARLRFCDELRYHMRLRGYDDKDTKSVKSFARIVGVAPGTVEGWLQGQPPRFDPLFRIIHHFGAEFAIDILQPLGIHLEPVQEPASTRNKKGKHHAS